MAVEECRQLHTVHADSMARVRPAESVGLVIEASASATLVIVTTTPFPSRCAG